MKCQLPLNLFFTAHIARSSAPRSVNTEGSITDDSINSVAVGVWHHRRPMKWANWSPKTRFPKLALAFGLNLSQNRRNTTSSWIAGFSPACYANLTKWRLWSLKKLLKPDVISLTKSPGLTTSPGFGRQTEQNNTIKAGGSTKCAQNVWVDDWMGDWMDGYPLDCYDY